MSVCLVIFCIAFVIKGLFFGVIAVPPGPGEETQCAGTAAFLLSPGSGDDRSAYFLVAPLETVCVDADRFLLNRVFDSPLVYAATNLLRAL